LKGNFHHEPADDDHEERRNAILTSIARWQEHMCFFQEKIVGCLLREGRSDA
jgi:hypothetical protein